MRICQFLNGDPGGMLQCCAVLGNMLPSLFELHTYCTTPAFPQCPLFQQRISRSRSLAVDEYLQLTDISQVVNKAIGEETQP